MSRGVNKAIIVGNLGADPELRYTDSGTAVCNMRVATSEAYKNPEGEYEEKTEWHNVVAWGKLAENCNEYLQKGSQAYFEGSLQTRSWEKDGVTRYSTEIKARDIQFLSGGTNTRPSTPKQAKPAQKQAVPAGGGDDYTFEPSDELPF